MLLTLPIRDVLPTTARASIVRLDLQGQRFPFAAGQAVFVASHGSEPRRPYSIASAPDDVVRDGYLELLIGLTADGTPSGHLHLRRAEFVDMEGPFGRFTLPDAPREQRCLFIAGGTGISPLRAMLRQALSMRFASLGVLYSARTPDDFAYEDELRALAAEGRVELRLTVTRDTSSRWNGPRGRISPELLGSLLHDPATLCFVCGPRTLVETVPKTLGGLGVAADRIRLEDW